MKNFKELIIWQKGIQIVKMVYSQLDNMPPDTKFELGSQLFKSAISIPSDIAEGSARSSNLGIALSSAFELETQLIILKAQSSKLY